MKQLLFAIPLIFCTSLMGQQAPQADPQIANILFESIAATSDAPCLDLACGTGSYTCSLQDQGLPMVGMDSSRDRLVQAKKKNPDINWIQRTETTLPFDDGTFAGCIYLLVRQKVKNHFALFKEVFRVMKPGKFVILTSLPNQVRQLWLNRYFPKTIRRFSKEVSPLDLLEYHLLQAGFTHIKTKPYSITKESCDPYLHVGKYHPELLLDATLRKQITPFEKPRFEKEVDDGLKKLEKDITDGLTQSVIEANDREAGDLTFLICEKL